MWRLRLATSAGLGGSLSEVRGDDHAAGAVHLVVGDAVDGDELRDRVQQPLGERHVARQRSGEFPDGVGKSAQVTVT